MLSSPIKILPGLIILSGFSELLWPLIPPDPNDEMMKESSENVSLCVFTERLQRRSGFLKCPLIFHAVNFLKTLSGSRPVSTNRFWTFAFKAMTLWPPVFRNVWEKEPFHTLKEIQIDFRRRKTKQISGGCLKKFISLHELHQGFCLMQLWVKWQKP